MLVSKTCQDTLYHLSEYHTGCFKKFQNFYTFHQKPSKICYHQVTLLVIKCMKFTTVVHYSNLVGTPCIICQIGRLVLTWIFFPRRPNSLGKPIRRCREVRRDWFYLYWLLAKESQSDRLLARSGKRKDVRNGQVYFTASREPTLFQYQIFKPEAFFMANNF